MADHSYNWEGWSRNSVRYKEDEAVILADMTEDAFREARQDALNHAAFKAAWYAGEEFNCRWSSAYNLAFSAAASYLDQRLNGALQQGSKRSLRLILAYWPGAEDQAYKAARTAPRLEQEASV
jgi:hypothetical protein